jgi:hypothetical protein
MRAILFVPGLLGTALIVGGFSPKPTGWKKIAIDPELTPSRRD